MPLISSATKVTTLRQARKAYIIINEFFDTVNSVCKNCAAVAALCVMVMCEIDVISWHLVLCCSISCQCTLVTCYFCEFRLWTGCLQLKFIYQLLLARHIAVRRQCDVFTLSITLLQTRMWTNAQRDGRPAKHRWRPLFNAAKFGWRPLLDAVQ